MQFSSLGVVSGSILSVGKLIGIQSWWNHVANDILLKPLKTFAHNGSECHRMPDASLVFEGSGRTLGFSR